MATRRAPDARTTDGENMVEPGLYEIPETEYHRDEAVPGGSFSSTMAKQILRSPAHLRHYLDAPRIEKDAYDYGHAVHAGVLGVGLDVVILDYPDWRTKKAQQERDEVRASGGVPYLERDYAGVRAAIAAVAEHPLAAEIFADGLAERSMFGVDPETGLWLRGRVDWITPDHYLVDLKTARNGEPHAFEREGRRLGYDLQGAFYTHLYKLATGTAPRGFRFVTVENDGPHLVDVHEPPDWADIGEAKRKLALSLYRDCLSTGQWPGRPPVINRISSPDWALIEEEIE